MDRISNRYSLGQRIFKISVNENDNHLLGNNQKKKKNENDYHLQNLSFPLNLLSDRHEWA